MVRGDQIWYIFCRMSQCDLLSTKLAEERGVAVDFILIAA